MLTPQEVSTHAFTKAVMGGYNMAAVDEFLDVLTEDYSALYSENAVLKSKMKVLVDKVEEYRSTEEAMRFGEGHIRMGKPNMAKLTFTMLTNKAVGE